MVDYAGLDKVVFVLSPQNPLKIKKNLLDEYERLEMVRLAIEGDSRFEVSDIEFYLPRPSYTIDTLNEFESRYPNQKWVIIMGADALKSLPKWKSYKEIISKYFIYAYPRPEVVIEEEALPENIRIFNDVPVMYISATFVRQALSNRKTARYLLPEKVYTYIDRNGFYL
jgi:nicotinate-nucleotide adenylyltransferase